MDKELKENKNDNESNINICINECFILINY